MLHRLLAADPSVRAPQYWEFVHNEDVAPCNECSNDPRIRGVEQDFAAASTLSPNYLAELNKFHPISATAVDEVTPFIERYLWVLHHPLLAPSAVTKLNAWFSDQTVDRSFIMVHLRAWLALQASTAPSPDDVHWVLKSPSLSWMLPEMVDTFPDARLLLTSRDPKKVVPSFAGLFAAFLSTYGDFGRWGLESFGATSLNQSVAFVRAQNELLEAHPQKVLHISYDKMMTDPLAAMRLVYAHTGRTLSETAEHAMKRHMTENQQYRHGKPDYSLAKFGLNDEVIDTRFEEYQACREPLATNSSASTTS